MKRQIAAAYDRTARDYDQVGTRRFSYFAQQLVDRLEIDSAARVLEVATGRGALLFRLAEKLGPEGLVVGFDLSSRMVAETAAEARRRDCSNVALLRMDADALAFGPNQFDVLTCGFALFFLDFESVLQDFFRVLKPGGTLAVSVNHSPSNPKEQSRWRWLFPLLREVMGAGFRPPPACVAPIRLAHRDRLLKALESSGFVDLRIEELDATLYFVDEKDWWRHEKAQGSRMWSDQMSEAAHEYYRERAFEELRKMREKRGIRVVDGAMLAVATKPSGSTKEARR